MLTIIPFLTAAAMSPFKSYSSQNTLMYWVKNRVQRTRTLQMQI
jgi:hypothetical protein